MVRADFFDASFWTVPFVTACVLLSLQWWASQTADGGPLVVQRVSSAKSERDGMLGVLWYNVAHYALRPWPWILVAVASLIVLPPLKVEADSHGTVTAVGDGWIEWMPETAGDEAQGLPPSDSSLFGSESGSRTSVGGVGQGVERIDLTLLGSEPDWYPSKVKVGQGAPIKPGTVLATSDSERAYVVMMGRYLPAGLLGLAIAALLAAFMSTVDTHVNLASSFFVGDVYKRFIRKEASDQHYVRVARLAGVGVLAIAGVFASLNDSIGGLFTYFLAFTAGVGPVYIARWFWWRVRATTEITAMLTSAIAATWLTYGGQIAGFIGGPGWQCLELFGRCLLGVRLLGRRRKADDGGAARHRSGFLDFLFPDQHPGIPQTRSANLGAFLRAGAPHGRLGTRARPAAGPGAR